MTEVGRQPWVVYGVLRTADAVTHAPGIWGSFAVVVGIYAAVGLSLSGAAQDVPSLARGRGRARFPDPTRRAGRWCFRAERPVATATRGCHEHGRRADPLVRRHRYAVFGGADYGAGFWDLTAGGAKRGARARALIDHAMAPVWEANNVWLIFALVVLWTGSRARSARSRRRSTCRWRWPRRDRAARVRVRVSRGDAGPDRPRLFGAVFALSSVVTPVLPGRGFGAIASGRVHAGAAAAARLETGWGRRRSWSGCSPCRARRSSRPCSWCSTRAGCWTRRSSASSRAARSAAAWYGRAGVGGPVRRARRRAASLPRAPAPRAPAGRPARASCGVAVIALIAERDRRAARGPSPWAPSSSCSRGGPWRRGRTCCPRR